MNILFFLTPKKEVAYVYDSDTLRQALEKMENHQFSSIPIIREKTGEYVGTLTEGDLLRTIKDRYDLSLKDAEDIPLQRVHRKRDYRPVRIDADIEDLLNYAKTQNFVPVVDDTGAFIGIVTRKDVMHFLINSLERLQREAEHREPVGAAHGN
ncbi:MAG: CBS domain-containing protein [Eubacteriales bacterium]|nr:CBS domain-containing protein [Eubacteriales bacterium]